MSYLWIYTSIAGALLGAACLAYIRETKLGLWGYKQFDRMVDWLRDRYGLTWFDQPEDAWKKVSPKIAKKIEELEKRLKIIYNDIESVINQFKPKVMSVEGSFFGKNVKSMMMLGHARGMALLGAAQSGIPVYEYSPRKVKQAVTGNGNATKEQVKYMVKTILRLKSDSIPDDASDALAIALCHTKQFRYDD